MPILGLGGLDWGVVVLDWDEEDFSGHFYPRNWRIWEFWALNY